VESKDAPWENAPEPHFHRFWTPNSGRDVRLLRLREGESKELPEVMEPAAEDGE
jgi:hypothetical protein